MKIHRTINIGFDFLEVSIELTPEELAAAHEEKEHLYDIENVRNRISGCYEDSDGNEIKFSDDDINEIAYRLRRNIDHYEMDYEHALGDAMSDFIAAELDT